MKKIISLGFLLILLVVSFAQEEKVLPLKMNAKLFYETEDVRNQIKSNFVYRNIIITSDTLSLPFLDEFNTNTLIPQDFIQNSISDTVKYAVGNCVLNQNFNVNEVAFHTDSSYAYSFNTATGTVDSVGLPPVKIYVYESPDCFPNSVDSFEIWENYFRSTEFDFDPVTGEKVDSFLAIPDTLMPVATIYFGVLPQEIKWIDNFAYWNTTFPINPITKGVATLDGLNEFGLPYDNSNVNQYGDADKLTSKPINMDGLANDSSVFLSFFYQKRGLGDNPEPEDSLVLEFKNEVDSGWIKVWSITSNNVANDNFNQVFVQVRDTNLIAGPRYFYPTFQFRFRNKASISGNNDHWHIDYVRLDKNRSLNETDTVIRDVAFMYDFPNYLERYTMLPWKHYIAGGDNFKNEITIPIRDNGQVGGVSSGAFPINTYITNSENNDTLFSQQGVQFNPSNQITNQTYNPALDFVSPLVVESDSICFNNLLYIAPTDRNTLTRNDTLRSDMCFTNVMAYDDGTAERAYGLEGGNPTDVKKFAYEFFAATPDTLAAIQIHFSNIDQNVSNLIFSLYAWDSLELNQILPFENELGTIANLAPSYIDKRNGFATFVFDTAITVSGKFYVGWAQLDNRNLQIGYDLNNTKGRDYMYVYVNDVWNPSGIAIDGSPMIRVILDGSFPLDTPFTSINEVVRNIEVLKIYPNPSSGIVNIEVPLEVNDFEVVLIDLTGKVVLKTANDNQLNISYLPAGMYMVQLYDKKTGARHMAKLMKNN